MSNAKLLNLFDMTTISCHKNTSSIAELLRLLLLCTNLASHNHIIEELQRLHLEAFVTNLRYAKQG